MFRTRHMKRRRPIPLPSTLSQGSYSMSVRAYLQGLRDAAEAFSIAAIQQDDTESIAEQLHARATAALSDREYLRTLALAGPQRARQTLLEAMAGRRQIGDVSPVCERAWDPDRPGDDIGID